MVIAPENSYCKIVGKRIKDRRQALGMSQWQLANLMSYSESAISRNEKGIGIHLDSLPAYAKYLRCSVCDLTTFGENDDCTKISLLESVFNGICALPGDESMGVLQSVDSILRLIEKIKSKNY